MMFDHAHALVDWINIIFLRLQTIVYMYFIYIVKVVLHLLACCQEEITMAAKSGNKICSLHFLWRNSQIKLSQTLFFILHSTVYWEIFASLNCCKFCESIAMPYLLYCTRGSFAKLSFCKNLATQKFPGIQYFVHTL